MIAPKIAIAVTGIPKYTLNANMRRVWIPDQVPFNEEDMKYVDLQCKNLKEVIDILEAM